VSEPMKDLEGAGMVAPDAVAVCGRCGDLFSEGGGRVAIETFDGSAPEVGAARLCPACYDPLVEMAGRYLFGTAES
jgi:hypothetical protein